ncbi:hypothetical protein PL9214290819 [Planktothrix tepida PCC 9214]|uniref:Uncharacterized protein n=1 Tax=Planktothrix tepida PCC 9214 TaxID=671072 RepID=A0A1J1LH62_9CYAN|nr:hypothetical protein PL9214290819 [Planktothrix tepida PCC 9214]
MAGAACGCDGLPGGGPPANVIVEKEVNPPPTIARNTIIKRDKVAFMIHLPLINIYKIWDQLI